MAKEAQLEYDDLKPPRKIPLASSELSATLIGEATVKIDIHVGDERTITVRDTPIWILQDDMDEALLGDDVLVRLGIDVRVQLGKKGGTDIDYIAAGEEMKSFPHMGGDCEEKVKKILTRKVEDARSSGMNASDASLWSKLFSDHIDEFRTIMSDDPPACAPPLDIKWDKTLAEKVRPTRISYTKEQKEFMDHYARVLIANGFAYENPRARYCSEALVLPKVKKPVNMEEDWRLVVNLKKANAACMVIYWPLRHWKMCSNICIRRNFISYWILKMDIGKYVCIQTVKNCSLLRRTDKCSHQLEYCREPQMPSCISHTS